MPSDTKTSLLEIEVAASVYYNLNVNARFLEIGYTDGDDLQFIHTVKYFVDPTDGSDGLKDVCRAIRSRMTRNHREEHSLLKGTNLRSMKLGDVIQIKFKDGSETYALMRRGWERITIQLG